MVPTSSHIFSAHTSHSERQLVEQEVCLVLCRPPRTLTSLGLFLRPGGHNYFHCAWNFPCPLRSRCHVLIDRYPNHLASRLGKPSSNSSLTVTFTLFCPKLWLVFFYVYLCRSVLLFCFVFLRVVLYSKE